jgi:conserved oligomeric Golgi complex subunit 4
VEALLRLKRFNQLGGLQLDRNIRDLVTSLADVTQRSVRDKFARLTQVATLLSCESMAEVQEFFGPDAANTAYTWRLSDTQIREVLSQRHDFSQGDIARLVL